MAILKGYKVTDPSRKQIFGVACKTLKELLAKGKKKLKTESNKLVPYLSDGTIIDEEYFETLPQQTVIILSEPGSVIKTGADLIYDVLRSTNIEVLRAGELVTDFLHHDIKDKVKVLSDLIKSIDKETEEDFQTWLSGIETGCQTKEAYMEARCRDRIRGYFAKTAISLRTSEEYRNQSIQIEKLIKQLKSDLTRRQYEGKYFNRAFGGDKAMCDKTGNFNCGGAWNKMRCNHNSDKGHNINPYISREQRIVFSTWNLDHRIERSRNIVPSLLKAFTSITSGDGEMTIDTTYVYRLLFTKDNLKLVHIVCHDKSAHTNAKCDLDKLLVKNRQSRNGLTKYFTTVEGDRTFCLS